MWGRVCRAHTRTGIFLHQGRKATVPIQQGSCVVREAGTYSSSLIEVKPNIPSKVHQYSIKNIPQLMIFFPLLLPSVSCLFFQLSTCLANSEKLVPYCVVLRHSCKATAWTVPPEHTATTDLLSPTFETTKNGSQGDEFMRTPTLSATAVLYPRERKSDTRNKQFSANFSVRLYRKCYSNRTCKLEPYLPVLLLHVSLPIVTATTTFQ